MEIKGKPIEWETEGPQTPEGKQDWSECRYEFCEWNPDDDGTFWTGCGQAFVFNEGGPKENSMTFCPYCGAELVTANA